MMNLGGGGMLASERQSGLAGVAGGKTLIGGIGVTDPLNLQGTSGNGTAASAAINLKVGNNGGTTALTVLNNGNVGIGTTGPTSLLQVGALSATTNSVSIKGGDSYGYTATLELHYIGSIASPDASRGILLKSDGGTSGLTSPIILFDIGGSGGNSIIYAKRISGSGGQLYFGVQNTSGTISSRLMIDESGNVGIGTTAPAARCHSLSTTEQLRLGYDVSNYASFTVGSTGNLTLTAIGTTIYTDKVVENTVAGAGIVLKSPDGTRYRITVANGGTLLIAAA